MAIDKSKNIFVVSLSILVITLVCVQLSITHIDHYSFAVQVPKVFTIALFESKALYWMIHGFTFIPVLLLSFDKRVHFYKKWKHLWMGWLTVGLFFIIWDMAKTHLGIWAFNPRYIMGYYVYNLPVEELVFFVTVPYACTFIYECLNHYFPFRLSTFMGHGLTWLLYLALFYVTVTSFEQTYTFITGLITLAYLSYHMLYEEVQVRVRFFFAYVVTLLPFVLVDGILTGAYQQEPIIIYNMGEFMGLRITSLPVEDAIYLIPLMLANITLFENSRRRQHKSKHADKV